MINKTTQFSTEPSTIPVNTSTGTDESLAEALDNRAVGLGGIVDLLSLDTANTKAVVVRGYFSGSDIGSGRFYWDSTRVKSDHNGGTVISPTVPWDGSHAGLSDFLSGVGETAPGGSGCFVRSIESGSVDLSVFGAVYDQATGYDDAAFDAAANYSSESGTEIRVSATAYMNQNHTYPPKAKMVGGGDNTGFNFPSLATGIGIEWGAAGTTHTGMLFRDMKVVAADSTAITVMKADRVFQGSAFDNLTINGGDVGLMIEECWVSAFRNIYVREGGTYGVHIKSPTSSTQVNALTIDGVYVQRYETNWFFDGRDGGGRAIHIPHGASELSRKTSMIIDGFGGVFLGPGFYFEGNYQDGLGPSGEVIDQNSPVHLLMKKSGTGVFDAAISLDQCYIATPDTFDNATRVVNIAADSTASVNYRENKVTFASNTTAYTDYDTYITSTADAKVDKSIGETNSAATYFGPVTPQVISTDSEVQTGFTSQWDGLNGTVVPSPDGRTADAFLVFIVRTGGTTTSTMPISMTDVSSGTVYFNTSLPAGTYTAGEVYVKKIKANGSEMSNSGYFQVTSGATGDNVVGSAFICYAKHGSGFFVGAEADAEFLA